MNLTQFFKKGPTKAMGEGVDNRKSQVCLYQLHIFTLTHCSLPHDKFNNCLGSYMMPAQSFPVRPFLYATLTPKFHIYACGEGEESCDMEFNNLNSTQVWLVYVCYTKPFCLFDLYETSPCCFTQQTGL